MSRWFPFVVNLFANPDNVKPAIHADRLNSFYACVSTLISNQVLHYLCIMQFSLF